MTPHRQMDPHAFHLTHPFYSMENRISGQLWVISCLGCDVNDERLKSNMTMAAQKRNGLK